MGTLPWEASHTPVLQKRSKAASYRSALLAYEAGIWWGLWASWVQLSGAHADWVQFSEFELFEEACGFIRLAGRQQSDRGASRRGPFCISHTKQLGCLCFRFRRAEVYSPCMKRFLRALPVSPSIIEGYVVELKDSIEWVDSPDKATADYRAAVEVIQKKLKEQLGLETELVEIPYPRQMESKWVISKEDS